MVANIRNSVALDKDGKGKQRKEWRFMNGRFANGAVGVFWIPAKGVLRGFRQDPQVNREAKSR